MKFLSYGMERANRPRQKEDPYAFYADIVDEKYYQAMYPDFAASDMSALQHYMEQGWREGKNPCLFFDTNWYLALNADVKKSGMNPLIHYVQHGWKEHRNPSPVFNTDFYLKSNPDVKESGMNPLVHFLRFGWKESRIAFHGMEDLLPLDARMLRESASSTWESVLNAAPRLSVSGSSVLVMSVGSGGTAYYDYNTLLKEIESETVIYAVALPSSYAVRVSVLSQGIAVEKVIYYQTLSFIEAMEQLHLSRIVVDNLATWLHVDALLRFVSRYKESHPATAVDWMGHDLSPICPNYTLLDESGVYCGVRADDPEACQACISNRNLAPITDEYLRGQYHYKDWREMWGGFLQKTADHLLTFSESARNAYVKAYPFLKERIAVRPHSIPSFDSVRIAVLGHLEVHKGARVVQRLCEYCEQWSRDNIQIYLYGSNPLKLSYPCLIERGPYNRSELPELMSRDRIDIIFIPSICNETFCYTAGEGIALGLPVACFDLGGQAEQVKKYDKGIILSSQDEKYLYDTFIQFAKPAATGSRAQGGAPSASGASSASVSTVIVQDRTSQEFLRYLYGMRKDKSCFVKECEQGIELKSGMPKLIAFYLPQFHDFPENIRWFGRGFSEWTNTSQTLPQFVGHRQPQIPIDVGYYNLQTTHVMKRQAELAKKYGIYGFSVYYYWFSGQKLMDQPMRRLLEDKTIDFPFFFFWANEDWTRLWGDGNDRETLYKSEILPDDAVKFMNDALPYMKDNRYIRIGGKPALIIYKLKKSPKEALLSFIDQIREIARKEGLGGIYISGIIEEWMDVNRLDEYQAEYHLDAITQFSSAFGRQLKEKKTVFVDPDCRSHVFDMSEYVANKRYLMDTKANLYAGLFTNWDNSPRRYDRGATILQNTPEDYKTWLIDLIHWTKEHHSEDDQYIFINAWNEWAESAHVEPDTYYGYAYLQKTKEALEEAD